jgi:lipoyl(octanoyl) transferase
MVASSEVIRWHWLGRAPYRRVWADQLALRERVRAGAAGAVLLCEHPPVITLGRSAAEVHILDAGDVPIERIERGGEVTYHGPGQLMIYPVVRIGRIRDFLACVGGAIAEACAALGVRGAAWQRDPAGVWCGDAKLAACGIHVAHGVSVHGFALDVATPAHAWARIRACGLDAPHASISSALGREISAADAAIEVGPRVAAAASAVR